MKKTIKMLTVSLVSVTALLTFNMVHATPTVGQPAPDFEVVNSNDKLVSLSSLHGKTVVMEWTNDQCPYVKKHYQSGNMQALQKEATSDGVVWLSVVSSGEGYQGHVDGEQANALSAKRNASPSHVLLDPSGDLGRLYGARTTPHMFVVNADGILAYMGGIDDKPTADKADIDGAENYVRSALAEIKAGLDVSTPTSRPYGCGVKYD